MHHRHRKRAGSADEEAHPGGVLISFNASEMEDHNHHNHNTYPNHHNGTTTSTTSTVHSPYRRGSGGSSCNNFACVAILLVVCPLLIGFSIFSIFHVALRGRPEWLYGKPVLRKDISDCLVMNDPTQTLSPPRVLWEWHNYTSSATNNNKNDEKNEPATRLLIAQYSGFGEYAQFLNWISPVHQDYAQHYGYDYVILQGTLLQFEGIQPDCLSDLRATFDKIPLLEMAYSLKHQYDYVLVLDTDAMIVEHDQNNWQELLPSHQLLAAQRVMRYDLSNTWDVNAGVTLWNLHHPDFANLVQRWKQLSLFGTTTVDDDGKNNNTPSNTPSKKELKKHLKTILTKNDDQYFLQTALLNAYTWWNRPVVAVIDEFKYYSGTLVKHFKRDKRSWSTNGLEQRLERVKEAIREICISQKGISHCVHQNEPPAIDYTKRQPPEVTTWL